MRSILRRKSQLERHAQQIRGILTSLGVDPDSARFLDEPDRAGWVMKHGSATLIIAVSIGEDDDDGWFSVSSLLVFLPEGDLLPLYRRLLELNANRLCGASLGADKDVVLIRGDRRLKGMDAHEAEEIVQRVRLYADQIDDELHEEFGAPFWKPHR
jgi:hypothetical protein